MNDDIEKYQKRFEESNYDYSVVPKKYHRAVYNITNGKLFGKKIANLNLVVSMFFLFYYQLYQH